MGRFGSFVDMGGHGSYHWKKLGGITHVGGFGELSAKQQKKLEKAFLAATKKGAAKDKAKAKIEMGKAKAKMAKEKAKVAKAKAKAKAMEIKEKAKAKKT